jgi:GTPase SAR1 family protein
MKSTVFGQFVVGSPGAGKSTYCKAVCEFLNGANRKCVVVNLDPANDNALPYECAVDVRELITLDEAMRAHALGPNGAMLFCAEVLEKNLDTWLLPRLQEQKDAFLLFDCPGQIELFTHHDRLRKAARKSCKFFVKISLSSLRNVLHRLTFKTSLRLCCVNLVDAHHVADASKFVALTLISLTMMLQLELPHVNVLSKVDLLEQFGELPLGLEYYAEATDFSVALQRDRQLPKKFRKLNKALAELVEEFGLVHFTALNSANVQNVAAVTRLTDKACGYVYRADEMNEMIAKAQADLDLAEMHEMYRRKT